jgi:hypothetical protein
MTFAFIIPVHPKDYHYIYNFIDLVKYQDIDIYLIFSSENDYNFFNKKDKINKIVIPQTNTNNIVTYKKFFALEKLKDNKKYEYFIVCDAEISIIPENFNQTNIIEKIHKIYENKIIYAGKVNCDNIMNITKTSTNLIIGGDKLGEITENYHLYFWWSDLPVYKREHLLHFFSLTDYNNINWYHFDHKIYLSYLILHHNFSILNITPILNHNWSLEGYNTTNIEDLNKLKSLNYGFSFITRELYNNNIDFLKNEGSFLLYHLDRF